MRKLRRDITIEQELIKWVDEMIEKNEFSSLSHAIQKALYLLKADYEKKNMQT